MPIHTRPKAGMLIFTGNGFKLNITGVLFDTAIMMQSKVNTIKAA